MRIRVEINGEPYEEDVEPRTLLSDFKEYLDRAFDHFATMFIANTFQRDVVRWLLAGVAHAGCRLQRSNIRQRIVVAVEAIFACFSHLLLTHLSIEFLQATFSRL